ncbi:MAG: hypothetical protein IH835_05760 [Proteobacteria bacterium]|nr:hypothetical protein [Pseudomonadota bacterium]
MPQGVAEQLPTALRAQDQYAPLRHIAELALGEQGLAVEAACRHDAGPATQVFHGLCRGRPDGCQLDVLIDDRRQHGFAVIRRVAGNNDRQVGSGERMESRQQLARAGGRFDFYGRKEHRNATGFFDQPGKFG